MSEGMFKAGSRWKWKTIHFTLFFGGSTSLGLGISFVISTVDDDREFFGEAAVLVFFNPSSTLEASVIILMFEVKFIHSFLEQLLNGDEFRPWLLRP